MRAPNTAMVNAPVGGRDIPLHCHVQRNCKAEEAEADA
jgi:hypothetical protein